MSQVLPLDSRETCAELLELAIQLDDYLRAIRSENLDGSEDALGDLLEVSHDLLTHITEKENAA